MISTIFLFFHAFIIGGIYLGASGDHLMSPSPFYLNSLSDFLSSFAEISVAGVHFPSGASLPPSEDIKGTASASVLSFVKPPRTFPPLLFFRPSPFFLRILSPLVVSALAATS